jgi:hypothetical protein
LIASGATLLLAPTPSVAQTDAFNGAWKINHELSDDFQEKMRETMEARGQIQSTGSSARVGGGGGRRAAGDGGGDFSDAQRAEAQEFRRMAASAIEQFEFGAAQGMVAFRYPDGRSLLLKDGEYTRQRVGQKQDIELNIKAEWEKEKLEVEREIRSSGKVKEVYWLNEAGQLVVDAVVDLGRGSMKVELRRVYDRVDG